MFLSSKHQLIASESRVGDTILPLEKRWGKTTATKRFCSHNHKILISIICADYHTWSACLMISSMITVITIEDQLCHIRWWRDGAISPMNGQASSPKHVQDALSMHPISNLWLDYATSLMDWGYKDGWIFLTYKAWQMRYSNSSSITSTSKSTYFWV